MKKTLLALMLMLVPAMAFGQFGPSTGNTFGPEPIPAGPRWFYEQASDPAAIANTVICYGKEDGGGVTQFFCEDSAGVVTQITPSGGVPGGIWLDDGTSLYTMNTPRNVWMRDDDDVTFGNTSAAPDAGMGWDTTGTDTFRMWTTTGNIDISPSSLNQINSTLTIPTGSVGYNISATADTNASNLSAMQAIIASGGLLNPGESISAQTLGLTASAADAAGSYLIGNPVILTAGQPLNAATTIGFISDFSGSFGFGTPNTTGDILGFVSSINSANANDVKGYITDVKASGAIAGDLQGAKFDVTNDTVPIAGNMAGVHIEMFPNVAAIPSVKGLFVENSGSQTGNDAIGILGDWVNAINSASGKLVYSDTMTDEVGINFFSQHTLTITPTANSAANHIGMTLNADHTSNFDLTATTSPGIAGAYIVADNTGIGDVSLGAGGNFAYAQEGAGTTATGVGLMGTLTANGGSVTQGTAFNAMVETDGGSITDAAAFTVGFAEYSGNITNAYALALDNHIGTPTNTYFLLLEALSDWKSGENLVVDDNGTPKYIALFASPSSGSATLDDAYDFGGAGLGRTINVDSGAVQLTSTSNTRVLNTTTALADVGADFVAEQHAVSIINTGAENFDQKGYLTQVTVGNGVISGDFNVGTVFAQKVELVNSLATATLADSIGFDAEVRNGDNGNMTWTTGLSSEVQNSSNGTIADASGLYLWHDNLGAGTFTDYSALYLANPDIASATNVYTFKLDAASVFKSGENLVVNDNGTPKYIALYASPSSGSGTLDAAYDFGGAGAGRTINVDSGSVNFEVGAAQVGLELDATSVAHTNSDGVIDLNLGTATDFVNGLNVETVITGDHTFVTGIKNSLTTGGSTIGHYNSASLTYLTDHVNDQANSVILGETMFSTGGVAAGATNWVGQGIYFDTSYGGTDLLTTGNVAGSQIYVTKAGGSNGLIGTQILVTSKTLPVATLVGASIGVKPDVAGITNVYGILLGNSGSQQGNASYYLTGNWQTGIDMTGATMTTAISTDTGDWSAVYPAANRFIIDATTAAHSDTNGVIDMDAKATANNVAGLDVNITNDADVTGTAAWRSTSSSLATGGTSGKYLYGADINLIGDNNDAAGFVTVGVDVSSDDVGGSATMTAFKTTGSDTDNALDASEGGRILGSFPSVASGTELTLTNSNTAYVTGNTQIDGINNTGWSAGSTITLLFEQAITIRNQIVSSGTRITIWLDGDVDFAATADDTLTLMYDGTHWMETSRTVLN